MIDSLTTINLDDLVTAFGWQDSPVLRRSLRMIFHGAARKFATRLVRFDQRIGQTDLPEGARHALLSFVKDVRITGKENVPQSGPVLFLSNHPGMTDTLCLFVAIHRSDLKIIALRRPFLEALPHTSAHLIYLGEQAAERMGAVRKASTHLRNGGAVLTFPAGKIEPDPDIYEGASESLNDWLDSAGVFVHFAPQTKIVPVLVRNVLWDKAVRHPLTRLKSGRAERERLGASFQLLMQILFNITPVTVKVQFAPPIDLEEVGSTDVAAVHAIVLARMRTLVQNPPIANGVSLVNSI
jgi:hypothetical protein